MKKFYNILAGLLCCGSFAAQNYNMANGSITACSGNFYDSGGPTLPYSPLANQTFTICSSTPGGRVSVSFSAFSIEATYDILRIYDGNSTSAPLIGTYTGTTSPGTITASGTNASGCLTFLFTSDAINESPGWTASISCLAPCQTITANFVSSVEAPMADGVIRICPGETVTFNGSGTFSSSGTGATYTWFFGDGTTGTGATANKTYSTPGSFLVNLRVTDPSGCRSNNNINRNVQVSTNPTITSTASPPSICAGQSSNLAANVAMVTHTPTCTPPVSGTTFLPDGSGVSYSTTVNVSCYTPTATVTSASDITNVCLNMEHSYIGDLGIRLTCPNGQSMSILTYPSVNSSANLGIPWATAPVDGNSANTTPGTGYNYCFTPSATTTLTAGIVAGGTFTSGNGPGTYTDSYVPAGTYASVQPFSNLIGCPLNGPWTITVTDNISSDNGYIFSWSVNFASTFATPPAFTPTITSQGWVAGSGVVNTGPTTATVYPTSTGTPCYNFQVTNNFGCTYTHPRCITVGCSVLGVELLSFTAEAVSDRYAHLAWSTTSEFEHDHFILERSADGTDWTAIAVIPGHGTTSDLHEYVYNDYLPLSGLSYYRLAHVNIDGEIAYSEPKAVFFGTIASIADLQVFPNPSSDRVTISGSGLQISALTFTNALGQDVRGQIAIEYTGPESAILDVTALAKGVYMIHSESGTISFIKE